MVVGEICDLLEISVLLLGVVQHSKLYIYPTQFQEHVWAQEHAWVDSRNFPIRFLTTREQGMLYVVLSFPVRPLHILQKFLSSFPC